MSGKSVIVVLYIIVKLQEVRDCWMSVSFYNTSQAVTVSTELYIEFLSTKAMK